MSVAEVFLVLFLAVSWLDLPPPARKLQILELFAGRARITRLAKAIGLGAAAHDIHFDKCATGGQRPSSAMDILRPSGFLFLGGFESWAEVCVQSRLPSAPSQVDPAFHAACCLGRLHLHFRCVVLELGWSKCWDFGTRHLDAHGPEHVQVRPKSERNGEQAGVSLEEVVLLC